MSGGKWTWRDARKVELNLGQTVADSLHGIGVPEDVIDEILNDRESMPESIRPVTQRQIEWQLEESKRIAKASGLKIPRLTDS